MQEHYAQARWDAYHNGDYDAIERVVDAEAAGIPLKHKSAAEDERKGPFKYIDPGPGAIKYALEYVSGMTREQAASEISRIWNEPSTEKRVKRCDYCGYLWRDDSLRNTKCTCSDECKKAFKTLQKRIQRADKVLLSGDNAKKKPKRDEYYVWWLEYPFWLDEYEMLKQTWKHEVSHDDSLINFVHGQREIYGEGNRKVKPHTPGAADEEAGRKFNAWTIQKMRGK